MTKKAFNIGFRDIQIMERRALGIEALGHYPVVHADLAALLRQALPVARHETIVFAIVVVARKSAAA